jgi:hypothetical protein
MHEQPIDLLDELKAMQAIETAGRPFALAAFVRHRHLRRQGLHQGTLRSAGAPPARGTRSAAVQAVRSRRAERSRLAALGACIGQHCLSTSGKFVASRPRPSAWISLGVADKDYAGS